MGINFTYYPTSNRVPGVYVEMDPSQANTGQALQRSLILAQINGPSAASPGNGVPNVPVECRSLAQAQALGGQGSMLALMAQAYLAADNFGDLWMLPLDDNSAGQPAEGTVTFTGPATAAGTLNLYIAGQRVQAPVYLNDTATIIATRVATVIAGMASLPVTAVAAAAVVTLTSLMAGEAANEIDLRMNYLGTAGGETTPAGVSVTIAPMTGGTANPDITDGLAALGDQSFDFIVLPYTDTASLDTIQQFLSDSVGRWSWQLMLYGGAFAAFRGTLGECTAFGTARNDQHVSVMAFDDSPDPAWIWAAQIGAYCAASLRVDPGLPLQYIATALKAPPQESRWTLGERNTLLYDGLSTFRVGDDGTVIIERMATTYQENAAGAADNSYLDVETMYGLMFVARDIANFLLTRYARKKLVSDTTQITAGSNCVNSLMIKASTIHEYRALEAGGYVQNSDTFAKAVVVENAGNGLVKILAPVDLVNQLRQIAILLQFQKS
jgi:phage tail sheath gpL-like